MPATNTLGGLTLTVIAQETINALKAQLPLLSAYTTDFSSEVDQVGGAVSTRIPSLVTTTDGTVSGYNPQNATSTAKTVTLSGHRVASVAFTDKEVSTISLSKLQQTFIQPLVYGIAKDITQSAMGLINSTNYPSVTYTGASTAGFNADKVVDFAVALNQAGAPNYGRSIVLYPTFYGALAKDDAIQNSAAFNGSEVIRDGNIPTVAGLQVFSYNDLPNAGTEGLRGFACTKDAILIASRAPAIPNNFQGEIINVTEPDSQFTVQFRSFYDALGGQTVLAATAIYGVQIGNSGSLTRMVTGAA